MTGAGENGADEPPVPLGMACCPVSGSHLIYLDHEKPALQTGRVFL